MSNDKTLATVKHGGCVQLGGQAERAQFEAWCEQHNYSRSPAQNNCGITVPERYGHPKVQLAWEAWQAALAAKPSSDDQYLLAAKGALLALGYKWNGFRWENAQTSPGGQGDALAAMDAVVAHIESLGPSQIHPDYVTAARTARAALAALQPVGQEPVLYQMWNPLSQWDECTKEEHEDWQRRGGGKTSRALYAAPPAQAVDLAKFRKLASWAANCAGHGINDSQRRMGEELLALIDGHTSAPELCNCHPETCCCDESRRRFP